MGKNTIECAYTTLFQAFEEFVKDLEFENYIEIDERLLMHAILDCYADITRLKNFHPLTNENKIKTLAYQCSWMLKRKPIKPIGSCREDCVYINEKFVLVLMLSFLSDKKKIAVDARFDKFCESLLYYLKYRSCSPQILEMFILFFDAGYIFKELELEEEN